MDPMGSEAKVHNLDLYNENYSRVGPTRIIVASRFPNKKILPSFPRIAHFGSFFKHESSRKKKIVTDDAST